MLYLAEVQKQKGGLLSGGAKTELKLLACQRNDQTWNVVSEEVISAEEASKLNDGTLVLVELNPNRQVQRVQEAGRPLVNILQNFSKQLEKFKAKEEEIDQWKESLSFQAQEFERRQTDLDERLEELQQMESATQNVDEQLQEIETSRGEIVKLQAEIARHNLDLEGAWEQLRGEQRRLEEHQTEFQSGAALDEEQVAVLNELLERLSNTDTSTHTYKEQLQSALEIFANQQAILNPHWEKIEQEKTSVAEQLNEVEGLAQEFASAENAWFESDSSLKEQSAQLKANIVTRDSQLEYIQILTQQLQHQEELYEKLSLVSSVSSSQANESPLVNAAALENMSVQELQKIVQELQNKLNIDSSFVNEQEEELNYKQQTINELQQKISQTADGSSELESELADELDSYQMLNETLVGQRRSLHEQQQLIEQHKAILMRRQGTPTEENMELAPILEQIAAAKTQLSAKLQKLQLDIEQINSTIEQSQQAIALSTQEQDHKRQHIQALESQWRSLQNQTAQSLGRLSLYDEILQPLQDSLDNLHQKLEEMSQTLTQVQEQSNHQVQAIADLRSSLSNLIAQPEMAAS